jgi:hypothetical protein
LCPSEVVPERLLEIYRPVVPMWAALKIQQEHGEQIYTGPENWTRI